MKSKLVKEFKERGYKQINGRKIESYSFYELCGYFKMFFQNNKKGE